MPADSLPPPEDREARVSLVNTLMVLNTSVNRLIAVTDAARNPLPRLQFGNMVVVVALSAVMSSAIAWMVAPRIAEANQCICEEK
jgi:hypothetical protein